MVVDTNLFSSTTVSMVNAHLPKDKRKGKAEFISTQYVLKQNSRLRLKVDLSLDEPAKYFWNPAYVEAISDSSTKETNELMVLGSQCKSNVIITEPKEKPFRAKAPQLALQLQQHLKKCLVQANARKFSIGSTFKHKITSRLWPDGDLISMCHFTMKIICTQLWQLKFTC